jgi:hypothetical protein
MQVNDVVETASLVSNRRCDHVSLRSFAFKDGQQIKCCPSCTLFDQHRREVLCASKSHRRGNNEYKYPSGHFRTLHDSCQFPNGVEDGVRVFCDRNVVQEIEGYQFCDMHAPMVERGCLGSITYTDGSTPRAIIESAMRQYGPDE